MGERAANSLRERVEPRHTAVLTLELQRGVVGDLARFEALSAAVAEASLLENTADPIAVWS